MSFIITCVNFTIIVTDIGRLIKFLPVSDFDSIIFRLGPNLKIVLIFTYVHMGPAARANISLVDSLKACFDNREFHPRPNNSQLNVFACGLG